jgi:hypothetical protein
MYIVVGSHSGNVGKWKLLQERIQYWGFGMRESLGTLVTRIPREFLYMAAGKSLQDQKLEVR